MGNIFEMSLEDKLYRTRFEPDPDNPHIEVDQGLCKGCEERPCLFMCPAKVYKTNPNDPSLISIFHENCLECGTCRKVCPKGAIRWRFPDGGMGVKYRFG